MKMSGFCNFLSEMYSLTKKNYGNDMAKLGPYVGHMWPICGNGMGSLVGGMELMWDLILAKCNLWKIYGKKT